MLGRMRIVSLLPSASEIVADLGLLGSLVGRSHECQWPEGVRSVPVVSASRIDSAALSGRQIDEAVRAAVEKGETLYAVDGDLLASLRPDVIITQDLCKVCAVSGAEMADVGAKVISLGPHTLSEVAESVRYLGRELGVADRGLAGKAPPARLRRGMDRPAFRLRSLDSRNGRGGRRRRSARPRGGALGADDLGRSARRGAGTCHRRALRFRRRARGSRSPVGRCRLSGRPCRCRPLFCQARALPGRRSGNSGPRFSRRVDTAYFKPSTSCMS